MCIDAFPDWAKAGHWGRVVYELKIGRYKTSPVRRVEIDKPDGSKRPLSIPTVVDRIIQQAVKQVHSIIKSGRRFTVDVDLSKFSDRVNHDLLMTLLGRKAHDKRVLRLIKRYLRAGFIDNQLFQESREGVPQGGPLSPLLSNIMLDPQFARYADDFTILLRSQGAGERVLSSISRFL